MEDLWDGGGGEGFELDTGEGHDGGGFIADLELLGGD